MKKYTIIRERRKFPIVFFIILLLGILVVEIYYFEILYKKRINYLNVPDYEPISIKITHSLLFIKGDFPLSAKVKDINLFLFKGFSISLKDEQTLKIYSNEPYHIVFSDGKNEYEFFGKILYLRCVHGSN